MEDFFKYVNPVQEDMDWGLYVNCAGRATVRPGMEYPPPEHPSGYYYKYKNGRVLNEYQVHYITEGEGRYENRGGGYRIMPGSVLITKPGIWHRYRPGKNTGWIENYVGFTGHIAHQILGRPWFMTAGPVVNAGLREEFIDTYEKIFHYILEEKPGYQQVIAGMIMKLLGFLVSMEKLKDFTDIRVEKIIQESRFWIRENVEAELDFQAFAEKNSISYSYFRKMFKKYTGVPPVKYHLDLKVLRAKEMLLHSDLSIKEISFELGFHSAYYFSRVFKAKHGSAPSEIRKTVQS
jgi:AraC-like DNA-binding protein